MGNYASQAELQTRFEDAAELEFLTDKTEGSGVDTDVLDDVIEAAEGEIDSGLAMKYATPVDVSVDTALAALLKRKTLDLAEVYLHRRGEAASDVKQDQLDQVLEWIEKMATGKRRLVGAVTVDSTTSGDPRGTWTDSGRSTDSTDRYFTRETTGRL